MKIIGANVTGSFILNGQDVTTTIQTSNTWSGSVATTGSNAFRGNQTITGSLTVFTSGSSFNQTSNGVSYQSLVGTTTAGSTTVNKSIAYVGNNVALSYNIYAYQSTGSVAAISGNGVVVEGNYTDSGVASLRTGNITSNMFLQWSSSYLQVNVTYTGTAPTVYWSVRGVSFTPMLAL